MSGGVRALSTDENVGAVRRAFDDGGRRHRGTLVELLAPDVVYTLIGDTALSGVYRGRDAVLTQLFEPLGAALAAPLSFDIQQLIAAGDHVVMQATSRTTLRSGAPYGNTYCVVMRFAAGRIAELTEYLD